MSLTIKELAALSGVIGTWVTAIVAFRGINTWRTKMNLEIVEEFLVALYQYEYALLDLRRPYSNYSEFSRSRGAFEQLVLRYNVRTEQLKFARDGLNRTRIKVQVRWGDFANLKISHLFYLEGLLQHQINILLMAEDPHNSSELRREYYSQLDREILYAKQNEKDDNFAIDIRVEAHEIKKSMSEKVLPKNTITSIFYFPVYCLKKMIKSLSS
ncbi:hypothetical protein D5R81_12665 [Parashewanella spongiae]|uniref:Uncharacterized protein n=1 Tax=Parashewanella spongiae TaxID=342950 RepID=A0A3A6TBI8_9GAMM|nr:hypothetical protein [Parashewanella spongiae]MCL1078775.1 hypothetical protein [Parashewanella spongiae]RJY12223.1 hypothetical protein D5R81_12665 [Parashewanella spongiae]